MEYSKSPLTLRLEARLKSSSSSHVLDTLFPLESDVHCSNDKKNELKKKKKKQKRIHSAIGEKIILIIIIIYIENHFDCSWFQMKLFVLSVVEKLLYSRARGSLMD